MEKILKRLTIKDDGHYAPRMMCSVNRYGEVDERDSCAEYCGDVISCESGRCAIQQCFDRLGEYEDLEAKGKLLKLPCAVGDIIYVIPSKTNYMLNILNGRKENNRVYEQKVNRIEIFIDGYLLSTCDDIQSVIDKFYKETWFLAREEAEAALKEL